MMNHFTNLTGAALFAKVCAPQYASVVSKNLVMGDVVVSNTFFTDSGKQSTSKFFVATRASMGTNLATMLELHPKKNV